MLEVTLPTPSHYVNRGWPVIATTIHMEQHSYRVFYRVSQGPIADGSEPFLATALLPAMKVGASLRLLDPISLRLLDHVPIYQNVVRSWYKTVQFVPIVATSRPARPVAAARGVGCFFSGGVDSFYSALTHRDEITHLIFIHGHDILLRDKEQRRISIEGVRRAAAELNKPLIEVETNARDFLDAYCDWGRESHGAVLGAVALLLAPQMRKIYIASSTDYNHLYQWGSHPVLDPLWSSDEVEVIHDGGPSKRQDKIERIATDDTAMRWLRVCYKNTGSAYNCGTCEKCLRTILELHIAGALDCCATLPHRLDYDQIAHMQIRYSEHWGLRALLQEGAVQGDLALEQALRQCLGVYQSDYLEVCMGLDEQMQELKRELRRLYSSQSWRMTAPLRHAGDAARRLKMRIGSRT